MICIIQARTNSYRLPKKILRKIGNKRMIELVVNQVKKSKKINKIIIATSKTKNDLKLIKILKNKKIEYSRGSLNNVAERFKDVIEKYKMKSFIRISADSPLIDSKIIDNIIKIFSSNKYDIVTNVFPRSFPKGLSVEAIKTKVFFKNFKNIQKKKEFREHVSMYFYKNSNNFKIYNLKNNKNLSHVNLSVDNINDLNFIRYIFRKKLNKLKWNEILVKLNLI